jgi:hypothetical protein
MEAAQLQAQFGLSAQQAQEAARQFNSGQVLSAAQLQAQFGMDAQKATELSRQFASQQAMASAQERARYGMEALTAGEASRQFGANYGLAGLEGQLSAAQMFGNLGLAQFGAQQNLLNTQLSAGEIQRDIENQGLEAMYDQFREERAWPYQQLQYQRDLLSGLPIETTRTYGSSDPIAAALLGANAGAGLAGLLTGTPAPAPAT